MEPTTSPRQPADVREVWCLAATLPLTLAIVVASELAQLPVNLMWTRPATILLGGLDLVASSLRYLAVPLGFVAVLISARLAADRTARSSRLAAVLAAVTGLGVAYHGYEVLVRYEPFSGHPPLVAGFVALGIYLATAGISLVVSHRRRSWKVAVVAVGLIGGVAALVLNHQLYPDLYPTLHLATLQAATCLVGMGLLHGIDAVKSTCKSRGWLVACASMAIGISVALFGGDTRLTDPIRPYIDRHTILGQTRTALEVVPTEREPPPPPEPDPDAERRLAAATGLPELPSDFSIGDYNVLLVTSEATRYDATSLERSDLDTTPNLRALVERGSFVFSRAYSPSSGTLHSMGSLMTMRIPSSCHIETWKRSWHGVLRRENVTFAERFSAGGFRTFWVGHDYQRVMTEQVLGFAQGFAQVELIHEPAEDERKSEQSTVDDAIADAAIRALEEARADDRRFFGWVFFVSPHAPYLDADPESPDPDPYHRYLDEIQRMDGAFGRLFHHLERSGLLDETIVLFMGDHGEEFGEHGGTRHKRTLYDEVIHVPLIVWIPRVHGHVVTRPVSTLYYLPWLALHDDGELRAGVLAELKTGLGPVLRETQPAVVAELIGHDRMLAALIDDEMRIHYDIRAGLHEVYDTRSDPGETRDLVLEQPEATRSLQLRMSAFRAVRDGLARFAVASHKLEASASELRELSVAQKTAHQR